LSNAVRHLVRSVFVGATNMCPQVLIAVFSFDGFSCLPLLFGYAFEVSIAMGI
jgi:hypothetical protein